MNKLIIFILIILPIKLFSQFTKEDLLGSWEYIGMLMVHKWEINDQTINKSNFSISTIRKNDSIYFRKYKIKNWQYIFNKDSVIFKSFFNDGSYSEKKKIGKWNLENNILSSSEYYDYYNKSDSLKIINKGTFMIINQDKTCITIELFKRKKFIPDNYILIPILEAFFKKNNWKYSKID